MSHDRAPTRSSFRLPLSSIGVSVAAVIPAKWMDKMQSPSVRVFHSTKTDIGKYEREQTLHYIHYTEYSLLGLWPPMAQTPSKSLDSRETSSGTFSAMLVFSNGSFCRSSSKGGTPFPTARTPRSPLRLPLPPPP